MHPVRGADTGAEMDFSFLVDDRPGDVIFRVDRRVYLDEDIFETELIKVFEKSWVFLCHESLIRKAGDYFATHIGRQPVFIMPAWISNDELTTNPEEEVHLVFLANRAEMEDRIFRIKSGTSIASTPRRAHATWSRT